MMTVFKEYGQHYIKNDTFLSVVGSVGAFLSGSFRIIWATLLDYYSFKRIFTILLGI